MQATLLLLGIVTGLAAPHQQDRNTTLRYTPGPFAAVLASVNRLASGALSVGPDGVLRSLDSGGRMVDYRQLDAFQYESALGAFGEIGSGSGVDGRSVLDVDILIRPGPDIIPRRFLLPNDNNHDNDHDEAKHGDADHHHNIDVAIDPRNDLPATSTDMRGTMNGLSRMCSPPTFCTDGAGCRGGCGACTYIAWFPYGLCLSDAYVPEEAPGTNQHPEK